MHRRPLAPGEPVRPFFLRRGSWIANSHGVEVDTQWSGMANLFGGEGEFGYRASGQGQARVSIYGAVDGMDLAPGETVTIDTGHVVAYNLAIQFRMRRAVQGRTVQTLKSGEGWVFEQIPDRSPREGIGGIGGLFNN